MATEEERFEEKFYEVKRRLDEVGVDTADMDRIIYNELRSDPKEDPSVIAFRIKGQIISRSR